MKAEQSKKRRLKEAEKCLAAQERQQERQSEFENCSLDDSDIDLDVSAESEEQEMADFEKADKDDAKDVQSKLSAFRLPWNEDVVFWF